MASENKEILAKNCSIVIEEMQRLGINCGREISRLAKIIHPDCIAIVPLYRSCIVIMQSEEEKQNGMCTIHAYGDPHWLGKELDIVTLNDEEFHFEFKVNGKRSSPEFIFSKDGKDVQLPINNGFDIIELAHKEMDKMIEKESCTEELCTEEDKLDMYDN